MRDFSNGIEVGVNEDEYQAALSDYCRGLVVSMTRGSTAPFTLHSATCDTVSYDLASKESPTNQTRRSGKILFRNHAELDAWLAEQGLQRGDLNKCSRCL